MPSVLVCPLSKIAPTVQEHRASHLVSVINDTTLVVRPGSIAPENHLFIGIHDIVEPMDGHVLAAEEHVADLIAFARRWDQASPMVIHCYAGISRSTAAAFITLCTVRPQRDEAEMAQMLRRASSIATPNGRLIALADRLLERNGRMIAAIEAIGRGETAIENVPFAMALGR